MALEIRALQREPAGGVYISPARICLSADDEPVECTDPRASRLLVGEGGEIPVALAERYGLIPHPEQPNLTGSATAEEEPKGRRGTSDKARKDTEDK